MGAVSAVPCCCVEGEAEIRLRSDGEIVLWAEGSKVLVRNRSASPKVGEDACGGDVAGAPPTTTGVAMPGDEGAVRGGRGGCESGLPPVVEGKTLAEHPKDSLAHIDSQSTHCTSRAGSAELTSVASERSVVAKRPEEVSSVTVDRRMASKGLGLELAPCCRGRALVVKRMTNGLAKDQNKKGSSMRVGDYVYEVNGVKDNAMAMLDQVRISAKIEIIYGRPVK